MTLRSFLTVPFFAAIHFLLSPAAGAAGPAGSQPSAPPKSARSVHLNYPAAPAVAFYNELTVEQSTPGSYFMACGWSHGYFGIQEQSKGRKVVIFSVWDPTKGNDAGSVPDEQRVEVLYKADDVNVKRFGGEGTGGQSFLPYDWKVGKTYRFLVKAEVSDMKTAYAGYFWLSEANGWKHLVTFRTRIAGDNLKGFYSFVEDFRRDTKSATEVRRAIFNNGWALDAEAKWQPLTRAHFTASGAKWEAKETIDAGIDKDRFYLQTGGDTKTSTPLGKTFERPSASDAKPPEMPKD